MLLSSHKTEMGHFKERPSLEKDSLLPFIEKKKKEEEERKPTEVAADKSQPCQTKREGLFILHSFVI